MNNAQRQAALNRIRQNIVEHGFHRYGVVGGGCPHYCYTIGLSESVGVELIMAGAYFYTLDESGEILEGIARTLRAPDELASRRIQLEPKGTFWLQRVHPSWAKRLMLGVFDYYEGKIVEAFQVVPDEAHRTIEIPDLTQPWSVDSAPAWKHLDEDWSYSVPADSVALTDLGALRGERITEAARWEEDEWEMFAGAGPDIPEAERRVVPLGMLLAIDPSLIPVVDLPIGGGLWRDVDSDWHLWGRTESMK